MYHCGSSAVSSELNDTIIDIPTLFKRTYTVSKRIHYNIILYCTNCMAVVYYDILLCRCALAVATYQITYRKSIYGRPRLKISIVYNIVVLI